MSSTGRIGSPRIGDLSSGTDTRATAILNNRALSPENKLQQLVALAREISGERLEPANDAERKAIAAALQQLAKECKHDAALAQQALAEAHKITGMFLPRASMPPGESYSSSSRTETSSAVSAGSGALAGALQAPVAKAASRAGSVAKGKKEVSESAPRGVDPAQVAEMANKLKAGRKARLANIYRLLRAGQPLSELRSRGVPQCQVAKDPSTRPSGFQMIWNDGSSIDEDGEFIAAMAEIGRRRGFAVRVGYRLDDTKLNGLSEEEYLAKKFPGASNMEFFRMPEDDLRTAGAKISDQEWTEDVGGFRQDNSASVVPQSAHRYRASGFQPAIMQQRVERHLARQRNSEITPEEAAELRSLKKQSVYEIADGYPQSDFNLQGNVAEHQSEILMVAEGVKSGRTMREDSCYLEGGNVLPGLDASGQPFAIVGHDSFVASKFLLEAELRGGSRDPKLTLSDADVLELMAMDLGLPTADRVFLVEQPGAFHIDMGMLLLGDGKVVVNDAVLAYEMAPTLKLYRGNEEKAYITQEFENAAAADLERQGLTVVRAALVFPGHHTNFINGEIGTDSRGQKFLVTNGSLDAAQAHAAAFYREHGIEVEFCPASVSIASIASLGGIGCRAKVQVESPEKKRG